MTGESLLCRMSIVENETVSHIAGPKEIQKEAWQCMQLYLLEAMRKT